MSLEEPPSKRPRLDALGRLSATRSGSTRCPSSSLTSSTQKSNDSSSLTGRGSVDGWTLCPLCGKYSKKKFALGKGIASHLVAIHTPWNPTKLSLKIERRKKEEQERQARQARQARQIKQQQKDRPAEESVTKGSNASTRSPIKSDSNMTKSPKSSILTSPSTKAWEPTNAEREAWDAKVVAILAQLEEEHAQSQSFKISQTMLTRTGSQTTTYRDSLPPFLDAAAKGDLRGLQQMVLSHKTRKESLLNARDRHWSTAEHWAAGGGHLECLQYLMTLRRATDSEMNRKDGIVEPSTRRKLRRRDGKTSLHYAARNGHLNCVQYLIEEEAYPVEEASGEGTLPLHMACFGGHLSVVQYLVEKWGANVHATNEWGCDAFQFVGLTICKPDSNTIDANASAIRDLCNYLRHDCHVNLIRSQKQGHSIVHKAAQKGNRHVLQWVADPLEAGGAGLSKEEIILLGAPDLGGHRPSQIWRKFQGEEVDCKSVAEWMESIGW